VCRAIRLARPIFSRGLDLCKRHQSSAGVRDVRCVLLEGRLPNRARQVGNDQRTSQDLRRVSARRLSGSGYSLAQTLAITRKSGKRAKWLKRFEITLDLLPTHLSMHQTAELPEDQVQVPRLPSGGHELRRSRGRFNGHAVPCGPRLGFSRGTRPLFARSSQSSCAALGSRIRRRIWYCSTDVFSATTHPSDHPF